MEALRGAPVEYVLMAAVLGLVVIVLAIAWRRAQGRAVGLERECDLLRQTTDAARLQAGEQALRCEALLREKHAAELELARLQAAQHERLQAFETMKEELTASRDRLKADFQQLATQVLQAREHDFRATSQDTLSALLQPFREQLQAFQHRVNQVHDESLRGNVSLATEIKRFSEVGLQMSREAETLARALKGDKKLAGNWGEVQLEHGLQMAGLERGLHYESQARFKDEHGDLKVPDFILKLPDGKHLVLDSKVSLVDYDRALTADTDEDQVAFLDAHVRAVRNHIDDLSRKDYSGLPGIGSPGFVLMFMPIEAAYIEALRHGRDLVDYASQRNVVLVSHSTLMPVLKTVSNLWMIARGNEQAQALADRAGDLYNQVALVAERLRKLGDALETVSRNYNSTVTAVAGQQGLHGKVSRFRELSSRANRKMPDLQPVVAEIENERLGLIP
ncbi:MAG: DNA recombination protein RmuC [Burkholderiaceae bacterium]